MAGSLRLLASRIHGVVGRQFRPLLYRAGGVAASLFTNFMVARYLSLEQIAYYYIYATLAYFGNAGIYVGLGVILQRICTNLAVNGSLDPAFIVRYLLITAMGGASVVAISAAAYLALHDSSSHYVTVALCCAALSAANYVSTIGKDLLALNRRLTSAAAASFIEQCLRLATVGIVLRSITTEAYLVTLAVAGASLISGIWALIWLCRAKREGQREKAALPPLATLLHTFAPISFSGFLNWIQFQSYRPVLLLFGVRAEVVGIVSLLTSLGMTGANPVLAVTAQNYVPRLYAKEKSAFREGVGSLLKVAVFLGSAAVPAVALFLYFSSRSSLYSWLLLAPVGVFIEAGNAVVGLAIHRGNATGHPLWSFALASMVGVVCSGSILFFPFNSEKLAYAVGVTMLLSQCATIAIILATSHAAK